jgi:hypothetical protein
MVTVTLVPSFMDKGDLLTGIMPGIEVTTPPAPPPPPASPAVPPPPAIKTYSATI